MTEQGVAMQWMIKLVIEGIGVAYPQCIARPVGSVSPCIIRTGPDQLREWIDINFYIYSGKLFWHITPAYATERWSARYCLPTTVNIADPNIVDTIVAAWAVAYETAAKEKINDREVKRKSSDRITRSVG